MTVDAVELRELVPHVINVLVRRGADFATAEDAVQEALVRALAKWGDESPADPAAWLVTVSWRAFLDMARSQQTRHSREVRFHAEPAVGVVPSADDTLQLYFLCAQPELTASSAVADSSSSTSPPSTRTTCSPRGLTVVKPATQSSTATGSAPFTGAPDTRGQHNSPRAMMSKSSGPPVRTSNADCP